MHGEVSTDDGTYRSRSRFHPERIVTNSRVLTSKEQNIITVVDRFRQTSVDVNAHETGRKTIFRNGILVFVVPRRKGILWRRHERNSQEPNEIRDNIVTLGNPYRRRCGRKRRRLILMLSPASRTPST